MTNLSRLLYQLADSMRRLRWDKSKLVRYQEKRLRNIVNHAYASVSFYHRWFKEAGINPSDIKRLGDLAKIPIVTRNEFRRLESEDVVSQRVSVANLKPLTTSGSTGRPLKLFISEAEDDWRKAVYMRANICCGQKPRDKWVVIAGPRHFGSTTKLQTVLGIYAQTCISVFDYVSTQASKIRSLKPDVLDGYSSSILLLAKQIQTTGQKAIRPRIVFGNAEVVDGSSREYIEKVFDAPYYDQYGCVEFNRTAWQCSERKNYHMDVDSVITQFVDKDGNEVSAGERGEIIQTSLFNYAMPFIRYEVGDVGVPSDDECSCGRRLPLMKTVEGRTDSLVVLPDGRILSPRTLTVAVNMFDQYESIEQFRIVQKELNLLEILVETSNAAIDKRAMETSLVAHINRTLHLDEAKMTLRAKVVDNIPPGKSGKSMIVASELSGASALPTR